MSTPNKEMMEKAAEDFSNRFTGVMKELAEVETWEEEIKSILNQQGVDFEWRVEELKSMLWLETKKTKAEILEKIKEYRDYWNSCGDELNKGKQLACNQLIKSLTEKGDGNQN